MDAFPVSRISSASTASTSSYRFFHGSAELRYLFPRSRIAARSSLQEATKADELAINGTRLESSKLNGNPGQELQKGGASSLNTVLAAIAALLVASPRPYSLALESQRQGRLVEGRLVYRQTFVIRSYEVGVDKTASIETLMNHFQEVALNHVWMSGLAGDGFGATHAMIRHRLIWVVSRVHVQVERYASWGDAIEIDTWVDASGKNGMRRDWLMRDYKSGQILARATSTWVVMNQTTRRLSKMPDDVREEITPFYLQRRAIVRNVSHKITKVDGATQFARSGLTPRHGDLDMNQHVNNVKYIGWMLESVPLSIVQDHEVSSLTLEYRRECGQNDVVESMTWVQHADCLIADDNLETKTANFGGSGEETVEQPPCLLHLLRLQSDGSELVRGKTVWRRKKNREA
ncbi:palmitoyl-acyl carrier protein thioesterase, chloroplastic [Selaginella moellendorffii]|nr:palmitoyl-acyl carrier protein thioesterase, chloroplastic [Selaginella moellendorffii]|eukprot:XP_002987091.2 palmitoyl-acyl carrier protein thioesterase, chloroplastic [Selaginella moellendorffii]